MMHRCFVYVILLYQYRTFLLAQVLRNSVAVNALSLDHTQRTLRAYFQLVYWETLLRLQLVMIFLLIIKS